MYLDLCLFPSYMKKASGADAVTQPQSKRSDHGCAKQKLTKDLQVSRGLSLSENCRPLEPTHSLLQRCCLSTLPHTINKWKWCPNSWKGALQNTLVFTCTYYHKNFYMISSSDILLWLMSFFHFLSCICVT